MDYPSSLENFAKRGHFLYGSWLWARLSGNSNKILKTTDRMCKIALSLNRIQVLKFVDKNHYPCEFEKVW